MIIFDLICCVGHKFEGWFKTPEDFELQLSRKIIACPHCGLTDVRRIPSAAHLAKNSSADAVPPAKEPPQAPSEKNTLAQLNQMWSSMLANAENVGREFANEARRIHYAESPARAIRGEATSDECKSLLDEGIDIKMLPVPPKDRMN